jgi:hypothetical protein
MKKQTAVEWVVDKLSLLNLDIHLHPEKYNVDEAIREKNKILQQAKAMEKEQIIDSFGVGCQVESTRLIGYHKMAEQYYNETYGGDK